jgi:hypothetical protein
MLLDFHEQTIERNGRTFQLLFTAGLDSFMSCEWIAFIGHRKIHGDDFLKAIQWAEDFPTEKAILVTPFHSPLEKEVTRIILRRGGRILISLARSPLKQFPKELNKALCASRVVFMTNPKWTNPRPTRERCLERNNLILELVERENSHRNDSKAKARFDCY